MTKCKYCKSEKLALGTFKGLFCKSCGKSQFENTKLEKKINKLIFKGIFK